MPLQQSFGDEREPHREPRRQPRPRQRSRGAIQLFIGLLADGAIDDVGTGGALFLDLPLFLLVLLLLLLLLLALILLGVVAVVFARTGLGGGTIHERLWWFS